MYYRNVKVKVKVIDVELYHYHRDCEKNEIAKHCWEADYNFRWD